MAPRKQSKSKAVVAVEEEEAVVFDFCCNEDMEINTMIECESSGAPEDCPGRRWYHFGCIQLCNEIAETIEKFVCSECTARTGETTTYKDGMDLDEGPWFQTNDEDDQMIIDESPREEESEQTETIWSYLELELEVEPITEYTAFAIHKHGMDHDGPQKRLKFLVEWENYPDESDFTWEFEDEMTNCFTLVDSYMKSQDDLKDMETVLSPLAGASFNDRNKGRYNCNNWVELEKIKTRAQQLLKQKKYNKSLPITACVSTRFTKPTETSLIILHHEVHCYIILWLLEEDRVIVSDSNNSCMDQYDQEKIETILGHEIIPIKLMNKVKVDFCGATAIAIVLELSRLYNSGGLTSNIIQFPSSYIQKAAATMYKEKSLPDEGRMDVRWLSRVLKCDKCLNFSTTKGRKALLSHQRQNKCTKL